MDQLYIDNLARFENVILNDFDFSHSSPRKLANMAYEFGWNDRGAANKNIVASGSTSTNKAMFQLLCDIQDCADESGCYIVDFDTELWHKINNAVVAQQKQ